MTNPTDALHAWANSPQAAAAIKARDAEVAKRRKALIAERAELEKQCEQRPAADAARDQAAADLDRARREQADTAGLNERLKAAIENVGRYNAMSWRIEQINHELRVTGSALIIAVEPDYPQFKNKAGGFRQEVRELWHRTRTGVNKNRPESAVQRAALRQLEDDIDGFLLTEADQSPAAVEAQIAQWRRQIPPIEIYAGGTA